MDSFEFLSTQALSDSQIHCSINLDTPPPQKMSCSLFLLLSRVPKLVISRRIKGDTPMLVNCDSAIRMIKKKTTKLYPDACQLWFER